MVGVPFPVTSCWASDIPKVTADIVLCNYWLMGRVDWEIFGMLRYCHHTNYIRACREHAYPLFWSPAAAFYPGMDKWIWEWLCRWNIASSEIQIGVVTWRSWIALFIMWLTGWRPCAGGSECCVAFPLPYAGGCLAANGSISVCTEPQIVTSWLCSRYLMCRLHERN